jgi:signal transduction histidine kinase
VTVKTFSDTATVPLSGDAQNGEQRLSVQMKAVTEITPAVAHDLRAPINAMVLNLEMLKETIASGRGGGTPAERERLLRYTNVVREELTRLHKGIELFVAHLSPQNGSAESCNLNDLASELAAFLIAPARKRQVTVHARITDERFEVSAHRYALRQALLHYGLATLHATEPSGKLEIELAADEDGAVVRLTATPARSDGAVMASTALDVATALWAREGGESAVVPLFPADQSSAGFELRWPVSGAR